MRIIAGQAKGMKLNELQGFNQKPTVDRVKEGIFSSIQFQIENKNILDLFAGTGQMGIEALSRGAKSCTFVDVDRYAHELQIENLKKTKLFSKAKVICQDSIEYLEMLNNEFDIVFIDPPYDSELIVESLKRLDGKVKDTGTLICEHLKSKILPDRINSFALKKKYIYGKIQVSVYRLIGDE